MGAFRGAVITTLGNELLARVMRDGEKLNFTQIKTSDKALSGNLVSLRDLDSVKQIEKVASVSRAGYRKTKVSASFSNVNLTEGYYVKAIGLYAMDPDRGEILFSVSVADESTATADWMPPVNRTCVSSLMVDLIVEMANASSVNVEVDPTAVATVAQVVELQSQLDNVKTFVGYDEEDIYGVEIDFESKTITRIAGAENLTEGADFDALTPWGGRKRCIVTDEGERLAYYGEDVYTETGWLEKNVEIYLEGDDHRTAFAKNTRVQVMVEQPVFYIKAVPVKAKNATSGKGKQYVKARFYISPTPKSGFSIPRAFYDENGIPQDKIYLSAYEGCMYGTIDGRYDLADEGVTNGISGAKLSSIAGAKPASGVTYALTRPNARFVSETRGAGWQLHNIFAMAVTEWLFMIEYASLDPQRKIGQGMVGNIEDDGVSNYALATGATSALGNGTGMPAGGVDGKCSVTYRGEENLWGNIFTWLDGVNILAKGVNSVWVAKIGTYFNDDVTDGYDCFEAYASRTSGYVSAFGIDERYPELLIPTEANGSDTFADYISQSYTAQSFRVAHLGGRWGQNSQGGFFLAIDADAKDKFRSVGARLLYVPQSTTK